MVDTPKGSERYPALAYLLDAWFHQDYDIFGTTLEEILPHYIKSASEEERHQVGSEIDDLIRQYGKTHEELTNAVNEIFDPEVNIDGWESMTTRQWLEKVKEMIR